MQNSFEAGQNSVIQAIQTLIETDYDFIECKLLLGDLVEKIKGDSNDKRA